MNWIHRPSVFDPIGRITIWTIPVWFLILFLTV